VRPPPRQLPTSELFGKVQLPTSGASDWHEETRDVGVAMHQDRPRIAIYFRMFSPYILARLSAAAEVARVAAIEGGSRSGTYDWEPIEGSRGFDRLTLFDGKAIEDMSCHEIVSELWRIMERLRPDVVVIGGWSHIESITMLRWAATNNAPAVVMSESTAHDTLRTFWSEGAKRFILKFSSAGLVGGDPHFRYINSLGMASDRIFLGYDAVDNEYFFEGAEAARAESERWRKELNLPTRFFLACSRFIRIKNLDRLIDAYSAYRALAGRQAWDLVLLGDGPERNALEAKVRTLKLEDSVQFKGFRQYRELPLYYGLAGAFVHVSTVEPWGLVINEALASRLPVVVSNRCGAVENLVIDGVNGFVVDPYETMEITAALGKITSPSLSREGMGTIGRQVVTHWGPIRFAEGLRQAIDTARNRPLPDANRAERLMLAAIGYLAEYLARRSFLPSGRAPIATRKA